MEARKMEIFFQLSNIKFIEMELQHLLEMLKKF